MVSSTLWQATGPLRRVGRAVPAPLRRTVAWMLRAPVTAARKLRGLRRGRNPAATEAATAADIRPSPWRIVVISGEPDTPGHDYRVVRFAEAAKAIGASVLCLTRARMAANHRELAEADFVVIWRAGNEPDVAAAIAAVRKGKAKLLVDIDDLMFVPEMASELVIDGIRSQQHDSREVGLLFLRVREVLAQADACVCTTDELAKHARRMGKLTFVLPNGFDANVHSAARLAVRHRGVSDHDGLFRIGYPAGTRTHQRDFGVAVEAVARILHRYPASRLVLFRDPVIGWPMLDIDEFPALEQVAAQIEWRDFVPLPDLPAELARLDANIVPLETGNPFCEAKSELKFFEAALAGVCTVASPTEPLRDAIRDGRPGYWPIQRSLWFEAIRHLIEDPELRRRIAHAAYLDVLWRYGPHRRADLVLSLLTQLEGGEDAARAFELEFRRRNASRTTPPSIPHSEVVFAADALGTAEVTVVIPLFNYARYVTDALESVKEQTLQPIDLVLVDDCSTDNSLSVAGDWMRRQAVTKRFNRIVLLRNIANQGLAATRNIGFDAAETDFVVPLDADNRLLPEFCSRTLRALRGTRAAFAYTKIQCFGDHHHVIGTDAFSQMLFSQANYVDAMALIAKWAWVGIGGYTHIQHGWEDYDFWCCCIEHGFWGIHVPEILAEYRFHEDFMLRTATDVQHNKREVVRQLEARHDWMSIVDRG